MNTREHQTEWAAAAVRRARSFSTRLEKMRRFLRKIDEHAHDGQNGSADYAMDRLTQIRKVVELALSSFKTFDEQKSAYNNRKT
jgi:hypothetical protein